MLNILKKAAWSALFGCLVVGFGSQVWIASHKTPSQQQTERPPETQEGAKPVTPSATVGANELHPEDERADAKHNQGWLVNFFEIKLTDLLIVIFTGALAWKTSGLFRETEKLRTTADKQEGDFLRSVKATEKAAHAAEVSAETARTEFISTHRPRIILREAITGTFLEGAPIGVIFQLANVGDTAGTIIRSYVKVQPVPRGPIPLLHVSVENQYDLGEIILGPGQAILLKFPGETPKWDQNRSQEKSYMSTAGTIPYRDATIHFFLPNSRRTRSGL